VGEELQRQTVMLVSAIKDVLDAVSKNKGRHCLVRRKTNLEAALESYERASVSLQQVADPDACEAATKDRRVLVDSSDDALDQIETLIEEKAEEKVGATEVRLQGDMLVEFGIKEVEEPRIDKLVVEESANKVELEFFAAEVEVERFDVSEVEDEIRTAEVQAEWMAIKPLEDPGEQAVKSVEEMQVDIEVKQKLGGVFRGTFEVEETRINKDGLEFRATEEELEFRAIRNKLQELRILESNHEDEFGDEFELQVPEFGVLRFLGWVSRSLTLNSEYG